MNITKKFQTGFTLIELLITLSIIAIIITISTFAIIETLKTGRDSKRKSDLETIRSGLEIYRADCGQYPAPQSGKVPSPLRGSGLTSYCPSSNVYISDVPEDPQQGRIYRYSRISPNLYELCASLEDERPSVTCGGSSNCGSGTCNYKVTSP